MPRVNIRFATVEDLPGMETLAKQFFASSKFLGSFRMERFIATWTHLIESGLGVILIDDRPQGIAGCLGYNRESFTQSLGKTLVIW